MRVAGNNAVGTVTLLLDVGADARLVDSEGKSARDYAPEGTEAPAILRKALHEQTHTGGQPH